MVKETMSEDVIKKIEAFLQGVKTRQTKYNWKAVEEFIRRNGFITVGQAMKIVKTRNRQLVYGYLERNLRMIYTNGTVEVIDEDKPFVKVKLGTSVFYTLYELVEKVKQ